MKEKDGKELSPRSRGGGEGRWAGLFSPTNVALGTRYCRVPTHYTKSFQVLGMYVGRLFMHVGTLCSPHWRINIGTIGYVGKHA